MIRRFSRSKPKPVVTGAANPPLFNPATPSSTTLLPSSGLSQTYVTVSPFDGGSYTEPADLFVSPTTNPDAITTIPSLPFVIRHPGSRKFNRRGEFERPVTLLFDLGLRSQGSGYSDAVRGRLSDREPIRYPDPITKKLSRGGMKIGDVDLVVFSHLHWSHTGDCEEFLGGDGPSFMVGPDALKGINEVGRMAGHRIDLNVAFKLPAHRTIELQSPGTMGAYHSSSLKGDQLHMEWKPLGPFPSTMDLFGDGSVYVVNLPGHVQGHIGMLCRCGKDKWVMLAGDVVHDARILRREKSIASWRDEMGRECCVHKDKKMTEQTLRCLRILKEDQLLGGYRVEIVLAHDMEWVMGNLGSFWPREMFSTGIDAIVR